MANWLFPVAYNQMGAEWDRGRKI